MQLNSKVGIIGPFYWTSGFVLTSVAYYAFKFVNNYKSTGRCWEDQNLIVGGKVVWSHVVGFSAFLCVFTVIHFLAFLTTNFAVLANLNPGVITTIWSVHPLF